MQRSCFQRSTQKSYSPPRRDLASVRTCCQQAFPHWSPLRWKTNDDRKKGECCLSVCLSVCLSICLFVCLFCLEIINVRFYSCANKSIFLYIQFMYLHLYILVITKYKEEERRDQRKIKQKGREKKWIERQINRWIDRWT